MCTVIRIVYLYNKNDSLSANNHWTKLHHFFDERIVYRLKSKSITRQRTRDMPNTCFKTCKQHTMAQNSLLHSMRTWCKRMICQDKIWPASSVNTSYTRTHVPFSTKIRSCAKFWNLEMLYGSHHLLWNRLGWNFLPAYESKNASIHLRKIWMLGRIFKEISNNFNDDDWWWNYLIRETVKELIPFPLLWPLRQS